MLPSASLKGTATTLSVVFSATDAGQSLVGDGASARAPIVSVLAVTATIEDCEPGDDVCFEHFMQQEVQAKFAQVLATENPRTSMDSEFVFAVQPTTKKRNKRKREKKKYEELKQARYVLTFLFFFPFLFLLPARCQERQWMRDEFTINEIDTMKSQFFSSGIVAVPNVLELEVVLVCSRVLLCSSPFRRWQRICDQSWSSRSTRGSGTRRSGTKSET